MDVVFDLMPEGWKGSLGKGEIPRKTRKISEASKALLECEKATNETQRTVLLDAALRSLERELPPVNKSYRVTLLLPNFTSSHKLASRIKRSEKGQRLKIQEHFFDL